MKTRLHRLEHRRRYRRGPPLPLAAAKARLAAGLSELAELQYLSADCSRRLALAGQRLAAEWRPTRSTLRDILDALDLLDAELDDGDD